MSPTYSIDDPRPRALQNPYTFFLPSSARLAAIEVNDQVKLIFRAISSDRKYYAERMWVEIDDISGETLSGRLVNTPEDMPQLSVGDIITFQRHAIIATNWADPHKKKKIPSDKTRQYWDRCLVDKTITSGEKPIGFMYREEADMTQEGDEYPDSGWRFRISQLGMSDDEVDDIEFEYVALARVLNATDDWLHLIDSAVGSRFWCNPETGEYLIDST